MNGYTKLFGSIIASTIWRESLETKVVWITMLAMSNKHGIVEASVPGLADMARVSLPETQKALEILAAPDSFSRTKEFEGRRIEIVDGGWVILNHAKYREKMSVDERREYNRVKQQEFRERQKRSSSTPSQQMSNSVNHGQSQSAKSAHTDTEADTKAESKVPDPSPSARELLIAAIYEAYPRRQGRQDALRAISKAIARSTGDRVLERTRAYATATALWSDDDRQFIPHPATWFNRGGYDDDPETWVRKGDSGVKGKVSSFA